MNLFNLGRKDEYGRQRRIEHRGRYLRASRTGGIALRTQARAAGVGFTVNTRHGARLSVGAGKGTQIALQGGRFILRGRYGGGPTRLNVSKTGASLSTRNALGTFNWTHPNRSSAKIAGVQLRGRRAAQLQIAYLALAAAAAALRLLLAALGVVVRLVGSGVLALYRAATSVPEAIAARARRRRNRRLARALPRVATALTPAPEDWSTECLMAGAALVLAGWGRGISARRSASDLVKRLDGDRHPRLLTRAAPHLEIAAERLDQSLNVAKADHWHHSVLAALAEQLGTRLAPQALIQWFLDLDEMLLADGPRTVLQAEMQEVFADFAGLRVQAEAAAQTSAPAAATDETAAPSPPGINLNTATLEELQALPHLGPARARAVLAMRPLHAPADLLEIDGIGPRRLAEILRHGVSCGD